MDGIKGNFSIFDDREIFSIFMDKPDEPVRDAIFSSPSGRIYVETSRQAKKTYDLRKNENVSFVWTILIHLTKGYMKREV